MKTVIKRPDMQSDGTIVLLDKTLDQIKVSDVSIMSIDGSTTNTGIAILRQKDGALLYTCSFEREKRTTSSSVEETPVQYKTRLKKAVRTILENNLLIEHIFYEEPFIGYATAAANLMMLRTFVEEIIAEAEPALDNVKFTEVNNKKWKKLFLHPDSLAGSTELEKKQVRDKLLKYLHFLDTITQDEIDAVSMGFVAATQIMKNDEESLASKKKPRKFEYEADFVGADEDDAIFADFAELYTGTKTILENGISFSYCGAREDFDKHIYSHMGDDDKVLIVKFDASKHGNIVLKHRLGGLASKYSYIYAFVRRKHRKY